jgi:hypothetical protein
MTDKKKIKKKMPNIKMEHVPFLGVLLMFAGFSLYGVLSFNSSLTDHVDDIKASIFIADVGEIDPELYTFEAVQEGEIFVDVSDNHPNAAAIAFFKQMGWVGGYDDGSFKPDQLVNRAESVKLINEVIGFDFTGGVYEDCFADCNDKWFEAYVCSAVEQGWVSGYNNGTFDPGSAVTKAQTLKMVLLAFEVELPESVDEKPYGDVEIDDWFAPYAKIAKDNNVVTGSLLYPDEQMNRASFVQILYNVVLFVE